MKDGRDSQRTAGCARFGAGQAFLKADGFFGDFAGEASQAHERMIYYCHGNTSRVFDGTT
jgi:hypothetical protein